MQKTSIPIRFVHDETNYSGWATPMERTTAGGSPSSYHVDLNEVFFGAMTHRDHKRLISEFYE
jgi:hypothetical protein